MKFNEVAFNESKFNEMSTYSVELCSMKMSNAVESAHVTRWPLTNWPNPKVWLRVKPAFNSPQSGGLLGEIQCTVDKMRQTAAKIQRLVLLLLFLKTILLIYFK